VPTLSRELKSIKSSLSASVAYSFQRLLEAGNAREKFIAHLVEWHHYVRTVCPQMAHARTKLGKDYPEVANYLAQHIEEEAGHDEILRADLIGLGFAGEELARKVPTREILNLIGSQTYIINDLHPVGFLGHIFALESQPPTWETIEELSDRLDIPKTSFGFYGAHCETDLGHIEELESLIDSLELTASLTRLIKFNVRITLENLGDFFLAIAVGHHWSESKAKSSHLLFS
jgi:hypothetical protein